MAKVGERKATMAKEGKQNRQANENKQARTRRQ